YFTGNVSFIPVDGGRKEQVIINPHTEEIVEIHGDGIACNPLPDGKIAGFFPVEVGQYTLSPRAVGVHEVDPAGIAAQIIGIYPAKGIWVKALIQPFGSLMNFF